MPDARERAAGAGPSPEAPEGTPSEAGERMDRETREFTLDGQRWRAAVARRGSGGHGLVYFLPLEDGRPAEDDRRDRRCPLDPGERLSGLDVAELRDGLRSGTGLTDTERRVRAPDDRLWLVQNRGPVWADDDVAEGTTGIVFTSLEGAAERLVVAGGHVGRLPDAELTALWRTAAAEDDEAAGGDDAGAPRRGN